MNKLHIVLGVIYTHIHIIKQMAKSEILNIGIINEAHLYD